MTQRTAVRWGVIVRSGKTSHTYRDQELTMRDATDQLSGYRSVPPNHMGLGGSVLRSLANFQANLRNSMSRPHFTDEQFATAFAAKIRIADNGCHVWTGATRDGYGTIKRRGKMETAHLIALELAGVKIPPGKEADHTCRNRACVNVAHLELVSHAENVSRGWKAGRIHHARKC